MVTTPFVARTYQVRVYYLSDGETFAVETFRPEANEGDDIDLAAAATAEASLYHDERISDLSYRVAIESLDPDDPTPSDAATRVKPVCSHCGADHLVRDECARWDADTQAWEVSGIYDSTTCDLCGAESDALATWVPADEETATDLYIAAIAALLGTADLRSDPRFEPFCLSKFLDHSAADAAEAWKTSDQQSS